MCADILKKTLEGLAMEAEQKAKEAFAEGQKIHLVRLAVLLGICGSFVAMGLWEIEEWIPALKTAPGPPLKVVLFISALIGVGFAIYKFGAEADKHYRVGAGWDNIPRLAYGAEELYGPDYKLHTREELKTKRIRPK